MLLGDIMFPREAGSMDGTLATVVVAEVLGGTVSVVGATLGGGGRTDWMHAMSVSLVPVTVIPRRVQYRCS